MRARIITTRQKLDAALKYAKKQEEKKEPIAQKLMGQHIVFVVDECHRALVLKIWKKSKMFPKSTWFGFTGTPIFPENRKQAKGQLHVRPMISMERSCIPIPSRMR